MPSFCFFLRTQKTQKKRKFSWFREFRVQKREGSYAYYVKMENKWRKICLYRIFCVNLHGFIFEYGKCPCF